MLDYVQVREGMQVLGSACMVHVRARVRLGPQEFVSKILETN